MKYKTLFRVLLKVVGVWMAMQGVAQLSSMVGLFFMYYGPSRSPGAWLSIVPGACYLAAGLYLFFGGKWIADLAIPGNRPYCHECGYDLTGAAGDVCNECGTPFRGEGVPPSQSS